MILHVPVGQNAYDVVQERGCLHCAGKLLALDRRVLVVTDDGVPPEYAQTLASQCAHPTVQCVPQGEDSKSLSTLETLLSAMLENGFTRSDCVVAVGGGVVGDLSGLAASVYMRGIDFYNIPTTVLSQVDSSIGGKTAVNFGGIKNIVGTFYQPKKVLIDLELLQTLPPRQVSNGLAEAVKMSLTSDAELFRIFEQSDPTAQLDTIIARSLRIKADVVSQDEKEAGLRRILNFGHTIGHGIESFAAVHGLYHGECVALGMIPMCSDAVRERLIPVLQKLRLPTTVALNADQVEQVMLHDKKMRPDGVAVTKVDEVGAYQSQIMTATQLRDALRLIAKGEDDA